jgi:hypothetical protein
LHFINKTGMIIGKEYKVDAKTLKWKAKLFNKMYD